MFLKYFLLHLFLALFSSSLSLSFFIIIIIDESYTISTTIIFAVTIIIIIIIIIINIIIIDHNCYQNSFLYYSNGIVYPFLSDLI